VDRDRSLSLLVLSLTAVACLAVGCSTYEPRTPVGDRLDREIETLRPDDRAPGTAWYTMQKGDTLYSVARRSGVSVNEVLALNPQIRDPRAIPIHTRIRLPASGAAGSVGPPGSPAPPRTERTPPPPEPSAPERPFVRGTGFLRPVTGRVLVRFGQRSAGRPPSLSRGMDFAAAPGAPVRAARGGRATVVRGLPGYGDVVVLEHDGGRTTFYGHLARIRVRTGQMVSQGAVIAQAGAKGRVHFRVTRDGRPVDPAPLLSP